MTYRVRFHPSVADDLQIIAETIANHAGPSEATRKILEIQEAAMDLAHDPEKKSAQSETNASIRIAPTGREGAIVFEMDNNTEAVFILAISQGGTVWISRSDSPRGC